MKKLILFELRKVFSKRLALIALIGIILFSALLSFSTFQNKYAFDQNIGKGTGKTAVEIDKEIAAKYEGILTDEKVQQMMNDFAPTHDLHGLNAMYLYQNATQSAAFSRFSDKEGNWNGLSVSDVFGSENGGKNTCCYLCSSAFGFAVFACQYDIVNAFILAGENRSKHDDNRKSKRDKKTHHVFTC